MTGLENSIKGTTFYINKNGEYEELRVGTIENEKEAIECEYTITDTEAEHTIELKNDYRIAKFIRKIKVLCKTDKERKAEKRFNKQKFREFIKKF